jgi:hypothetical protein
MRKSSKRATVSMLNNLPGCCYCGQRRVTAAALLASLLLGVVACDTSEKPLESEVAFKAEAEAVDVNTRTATIAEPQTPKAKKTVLAPEPVASREQPLNLDYKPSAGDGQSYGNRGETAYQKDLLPELFGQDKKAGKVAVSGGLLTDPYEEELLDSVNGAEVSLSVKTR